MNELCGNWDGGLAASAEPFSFEKESGFYPLLGVVKTDSPEGLTPVSREKQARDHLSVIGAMTPEGRIFTPARQESLNGPHCIESLLHLLCGAGDRLLVI